MAEPADNLKLGPLTVSARPFVAPECARIENHSDRMGDPTTLAPVVMAQIPQTRGPAQEIAFWGSAIRLLIDQVAQGMARTMGAPDARAEFAEELLRFIVEEGSPGEAVGDRGVFEVVREVRPS